MFWFICLLGVAYVVALIIKGAFPDQFKNYSSIGLAIRIILFGIGTIVLFVVGFLVTHWNTPVGDW